MHQESHHTGKAPSRTWIVGCFSAALVGLVAAAFEAPFHQTSAIELGVVSGICLILALIGWSSATPRTLKTASFDSEASSRHVAERSLQSVGAAAE